MADWGRVEMKTNLKEKLVHLKKKKKKKKKYSNDGEKKDKFIPIRCWVYMWEISVCLCVCAYVHKCLEEKVFSSCSRLRNSGAVRNPPTDSFYGDDNSSQTSLCGLTHSHTLPQHVSIKASQGRLSLTDVKRRMRIHKTNRKVIQGGVLLNQPECVPRCSVCVCVCVW